MNESALPYRGHRRALSISGSCAAAFAFVVMGVLACGGTSDAERGAGPITERSIPTDRGGRPADCGEEDGLQFWWLEDFETGSATGWYTNTDVCRRCNDVDSDISDLKRPLGCLKGGRVLDALIDRDPVEGAHFAEHVEFVREIANGENSCTVPQVLTAFGVDDVEDLSEDDVMAAAIDLLMELADQREALLQEWDECGLEACLASQTPTFLDKPMPAERLPERPEWLHGGPRCHSTTAMHIRTARLRDFGGTFGRTFSTKKPLDLVTEGWEGLAFWARVAPGSRNQIKVSMSERHTDEKVIVDGQPVCYFDSFEDDTTRACDKHGAWVSLSEDWELHKLPFKEMRQSGWGKAAPFFDLSAVTGLGFEYAAGSWDIWFDDIGFYRSQQ